MMMASKSEQSVASPLAPEDIAPGYYVAVLYEVDEFLPLMCYIEPDVHRAPETVRVVLPPCAPAELMRVVDVCLPFVLVKKPDGKRVTIDVRRHRLARVAHGFGKRVFKQRSKAATS
jgi:hypothetical protein